jgi:hypothetical protein
LDLGEGGSRRLINPVPFNGSGPAPLRGEGVSDERQVWLSQVMRASGSLTGSEYISFIVLSVLDLN